MLTGIKTFSQTQYKSNASGSWGTTLTWLKSSDGGTTWIAATATPTSADGAITILNNHSVTVASNLSVDELTVNSGGTLTVNSGVTLTINNGTASVDVLVNGTLTSSGTITTTGALTIGGSGIYNHSQNGGTIPTATWSTYSTCNLTGLVSTLCSGITQTFHHLNWNNTGQTSDIFFESNTPTVNGILKVQSTGTKILGLANTSNNRSWSAIDSFEITGGTFTLIKGNVLSTTSMTINSNLLIDGGTFDISNSGAIFTTGQLFLKGNLTVNSGVLTCNHSVSIFGIYAGSGVFFNGTTAQTCSILGGTLATSSSSAGARFFYKSSGGPTALNEIYNGSIAQGTINGITNMAPPVGYAAWPTSGSLIQNITINNSAGITLSTNKEINGVLTFTNGKLAIGSNTLTLKGTVTGMSATNSFTGSASSVLSITGTGTLGTLYFNQITPETTNLLSTLTMNRTTSGAFTLGNNVSVKTTLTLTNGLIYTGSNTLSVGTSSANGSISGGGSSSYIVAYDNNGTIGS